MKKKIIGFLHFSGLILVIFSLVVGFSAYAISDVASAISKTSSTKLISSRADSSSFLFNLRRNISEMPIVSNNESAIKFNPTINTNVPSGDTTNTGATMSSNSNSNGGIGIGTRGIVDAGDVKYGTFGSNVGGGDYWFPASIHTTDNAYIGGMLTVNSGHILLTGSNKVIEWGNGAYIKQEDTHLAFRSGGKYYFDNKVGIGTTNPDADLRVMGTVKANDFVANNGKYGISEYYKMQGSNGESCVMNFTNGLLTYSNCPLAE